MAKKRESDSNKKERAIEREKESEGEKEVNSSHSLQIVKEKAKQSNFSYT